MQKCSARSSTTTVSRNCTCRPKLAPSCSRRSWTTGALRKPSSTTAVGFATIRSGTPNGRWRGKLDWMARTRNKLAFSIFSKPTRICEHHRRDAHAFSAWRPRRVGAGTRTSLCSPHRGKPPPAAGSEFRTSAGVSWTIHCPHGSPRLNITESCRTWALSIIPKSPSSMPFEDSPQSWSPTNVLMVAFWRQTPRGRTAVRFTLP